MLMIDKFINDDLFVKGYLKWIGGLMFGLYCVFVMVSYYEWVFKKVRMYIIIF